MIEADMALDLRPIPSAVAERIDVVMDRLPTIGLDGASMQALVRQLVSDALARRNVPTVSVIQPRLDIAAPSIDALRYTSLREEFANLIATAMDDRAAGGVLPAYVEVLKQLSTDEINLLKAIPPIGRYTPIADLVFVMPNEQLLLAYRHILPASLAQTVFQPRNIPQYIDNLCRLSLLFTPARQEADPEYYEAMARLGFVRQLISRDAPPKGEINLDRGVIGMTDFGEGFRRACLG